MNKITKREIINYEINKKLSNEQNMLCILHLQLCIHTHARMYTHEIDIYRTL